MASYGVALIIIMAALAIIYKLSISGQDVFTPYCTPSPGFACNFYGMNQSGVLTLQMYPFMPLPSDLVDAGDLPL